VGPRLLLLSGSISYAVFKTPAPSLRLIRLIFGGQEARRRRPPTFILKKFRVDSATAATALANSTGHLQNNPHPEQTDSVVKYYL
jgi:hypothetical protein